MSFQAVLSEQHRQQVEKLAHNFAQIIINNMNATIAKKLKKKHRKGHKSTEPRTSILQVGPVILTISIAFMLCCQRSNEFA